MMETETNGLLIVVDRLGRTIAQLENENAALRKMVEQSLAANPQPPAQEHGEERP